MSRKRGQADNPFAQSDENNAADFSLFEADAAIFGDFERVDAGRQVAEPISIYDITPDPTQPRRAIPTIVRHYWDGDPQHMSALFEAWLHFANKERDVRLAPPLDPLAYITSIETSEGEIEAEGAPLEAAFERLLQLAASIRRDGLLNPITVASVGNRYRIETGERRWLAYHLLVWVFDAETEQGQQWQRIPAHVVDRVDVWRQASENNARANLNAIAKARQFAILLMEAYRERGYQFQPYDEMVSTRGGDRAYYAQVADGRRFDIPRGLGPQFVNAMGVKNTSQLRQLRQFLNIPDVVWEWADDLDWTVGKLRNLILRSGGSEVELFSLAAIEAQKEGLGISIDMPELPTPPAKPAREKPTIGTPSHFRQLAKTLQRAAPDNRRATRKALRLLEEYRQWLETQEQRLRGWLDE
ncbi:MAG: hypothetical protein D6712_01895 [Chloroflexi bacterium]|nr:MAG: hypothetical protein D6712_01895 [Chloroflexota bacterium]